MSVIDTVHTQLTTDNPTDYIHKYNADSGLNFNPLNQVTPLFDEFFGPYVLNIFIVTGPFDSINKLTENFGNFARYETHFIIDSESETWDDPDSNIADTDSSLNDLAEWGIDVNIFNHGIMTSAEAHAKAIEITNSFKESINESG